MTVSEKRLGQFIQGVDLYELAQEYDLGCIEHDLKEMAQELLEARQLAQDMKCLRKLMGYVENGSDQTVELFQDDATRDFLLRPVRIEKRIATGAIRCTRPFRRRLKRKGIGNEQNDGIHIKNIS